MSSGGQAAPTPAGNAGRLLTPARVLIVSSVMFTFISYWRTAAVVLCDLASTAYYIGGIVEQSIGPVAPWFILAVMGFSYAVRSVYIESCTLFVRGGVYRVVREALGAFMAKVAVSALMFDYVLTGPISGVSAGQYVVGLLLESLRLFSPAAFAELGLQDAAIRDEWKRWGSILIASGIVLYFFRQNLIGIHESSGKALKIMIATTIVGGIMLAWCGLTLAVKPPVDSSILRPPDLSPKVEYEVVMGKDPVTGEEKEIWRRHPETGRLVPKLDEKALPPLGASTVGLLASPSGQSPLLAASALFPGRATVPLIDKVTGRQADPLGFLAHLLPESWADVLRHPASWLSLIGVLGLFLAFGHSILAMSGEETLAQVYREVESPKLPNFKRAAFIVFVYSLVFTGGISFLAVLLVPDEVRMKDYADNLLGGLAMHVIGYDWMRLVLNAAVVLIGSLILSGAVNTSIIGSNGVLNRVAEDGVLHDWFRAPHPKYGTTHRILYLIVSLQLFTILITRGDVLILGEAYAFGVVWSFVFQALSMVVLRLRDRRPREYKVPLNIPLGAGRELPLGLLLILAVLLITALMNLLTKEVATVAGLTFTAVFFCVFLISEHYNRRLRAARGGDAKEHAHLEQFNEQASTAVTPESLGLTKQYRKLVAIRSPQNLFMLEKALAETDPQTTAVVVMTAKVTPPGEEAPAEVLRLDPYDQELLTAVVQRAERAGKQVKPLIVPTNNPLFAVLKTAKDLNANELVMGASNKYTADEQMEQVAFYWISLHAGQPAPLTVRIMSRERDMSQDMAGGNRIPKISERRARTVSELRAAGVGIDRVLMVHDATQASSDLFQGVLTILDPEVTLALVPVANGSGVVQHDRERARQLDRELLVLEPREGVDIAEEVVRLAREQQYDLIVLLLSPDVPGPVALRDERVNHILRKAHCRVFLASMPVIPEEVVDTTPSGR